MKCAWTGYQPARRGDNSEIRKTMQFYAIPASIRPTQKKSPPYAKTAVARLKTHSGPLTSVDFRIYTGRDIVFQKNNFADFSGDTGLSA